MYVCMYVCMLFLSFVTDKAILLLCTPQMTYFIAIISTGFLILLCTFYYSADRVTENLKDLTSQVGKLRWCTLWLVFNSEARED